MKRGFFRLTVALLVAILLLRPDAAALGEGSERPTLHFFWAENCPHCAEEKPFLEALRQRYPGLEIRSYEIWNNRENFSLLVELAGAFGNPAVSTPATAVGDRMWFGFSVPVAEEIEETVIACLEAGCRNPMARIGAPEPAPADAREETPGPVPVPLFGSLDPERVSLPLFTVVLGLLDGFNPCAFFVLLFLLSLLVHAKSRRLMLLVGGSFVIVSGLIYFLFMSAWLNLFLLAGQVRAITLAAGAVALLMAALNVKDYFFFHRGVSLSIPERAKPPLFDRMRRLVRTTRIPSVLLGTVVLAISANTYELLCTAGFPMVYTRVLTLHALGPWQYYLYLALYNVVYVLPLLVIVLVFTATLGSRKLAEREGRALKLVSGLMMFFLGAVLLFDPSLLNHPLVAVSLLLMALAISGVVIALRNRQR